MDLNKISPYSYGYYEVNRKVLSNERVKFLAMSFDFSGHLFVEYIQHKVGGEMKSDKVRN